MTTQQIGKNLEYLRRIRGLSLKEVAKGVGVTYSAISNYESGLRVPRYEIMVRIADFYAMTVQKIFFEPLLTK